MFNNYSIFKIIFAFCCLFFVWYGFNMSLINSKRTWSQNVIPAIEVPNTTTSASLIDIVTNAKVPLTNIPNSTRNSKFNKQNCKLFVCSIGNLGNQIWEYMSLFVVWKRFIGSGYRPYIEPNMRQNLKVFFPKLSIPSYDFVCDESTQRIIPKTQPLEEYASWFEAKDDEKCEDVYLDEYSSRYDEILDYGVAKIRQEMSFSPKLKNKCQYDLHYYKRIFDLENEEVTFVGMHYRGTDYVHHLEVNYGNYNLVIPDHKYYRKAMKYFKERYANVIFILITIDQVWLSRNIHEIVGGGDVIVNPYLDDKMHDLVLLSHCNHSIINYGTFGTTAALFSGGTTVVYDLKLPLDHRGTTLAMGIAQKLKNWHVMS